MTPRQFRKFCPFVFIFLFVAGVLILPITLIVEFNLEEYTEFFVANYPHVALYPIIFLWLPIAVIFYTIRTIPYGKTLIRKITKWFFILIGISLAITLAEERGGYMMSLEFSSSSFDKYCIKDRIGHVNPNLNKNCELRDLSNLKFFSRDSWQLFDKNFSYSRIPYLMTFFSIVFLLGSNWVLLLSCPNRRNINKLIFLKALLVSAVGLIIWVPMRLYYNKSVKSQTFPLEDLGLYNGFIGGPEFLIALIVGFFILYFWIEFSDIKPEFAAAVWSIAGLGIPIGAFYDPDFVRVIFGIQPHEWRTWVLWYVVLGIAATMAYNKAHEMHSSGKNVSASTVPSKSDHSPNVEQTLKSGLAEDKVEFSHSENDKNRQI